MTNSNNGSVEFTIHERHTELVAPVVPMQERMLPQSNLDLILPHINFGVFFCYNKPLHTTFKSIVTSLKTSLAQALVTYYPFAGEVVYNNNSCKEPQVLCNNRGVEFIEVYADVEMCELDLYNPDVSVEGKLVPLKKKMNGSVDSVLSVQVTEMRCGGVVVSCSFDHRVADAYTTNMFLVSWSEIARSVSLSVHPTFGRSMIKPRRTPRYDPHMDDLYVNVSALSVPEDGSSEHQHGQLISRMYYISADQLAELQESASFGGPRRTKLESFSAFLWQKVAKSAHGEQEKSDVLTKMGIVVDGRRRMGSGGGGEDQMRTYFGNVLSIPYEEESVAVVSERPLSWVARRLHECIKRGTTQEHFMDLIDWVETQRPDVTLSRIYCTGSSDGPALVVSSGQRFPVGEMDFGWGRPRIGSYHFPWGGEAGYVMPMPNPVGNGDWIVYMHLRRKQIEVIEKEAANVFKPLSCEYLDRLSN